MKFRVGDIVQVKDLSKMKGVAPYFFWLSFKRGTISRIGGTSGLFELDILPGILFYPYEIEQLYKEEWIEEINN